MCPPKTSQLWACVNRVRPGRAQCWASLNKVKPQAQTCQLFPSPGSARLWRLSKPALVSMALPEPEKIAAAAQTKQNQFNRRRPRTITRACKNSCGSLDKARTAQSSPRTMDEFRSLNTLCQSCSRSWGPVPGSSPGAGARCRVAVQDLCMLELLELAPPLVEVQDLPNLRQQQRKFSTTLAMQLVMPTTKMKHLHAGKTCTPLCVRGALPWAWAMAFTKPSEDWPQRRACICCYHAALSNIFRRIQTAK